MKHDLKLRLIDYLHHLSIYEYIAYGLVGVFFLFVFVIFLVLARKRLNLALVWLIFGLIVVLASPFAIKKFYEQNVRKIELTTNISRLNFAKMLVIKGKIKNKGKIEFKRCRVFAKVYKVDKKSYKNLLFMLKPKRYESILIDKRLKPEEEVDFKIVFKNFLPDYKYKTKVYGECY